MNEEIKEEAKNYRDVRVIFTDAAQNSQKQVRDVEKLLQEGIDLLIISPNEAAALTPVVTEAYKSIPIIVLDRAVEGSSYTLFIGPDNKSIGRQAGQFIVDLLGNEGGNIIEIQGLSGSPPVRDRSEGFREIVEQHSNIKIIDTIIGDWLRDRAEDKIKEVIMRYPKIDVVFAHNDAMAQGAYIAVTKLRVKGIKFVGIDGLPGPNGGIELVRQGILKGTFVCPTGGKEAVQYAIRILNREKNLPKRVILASHIVTQ
jgi:ABC-type sugar transport system substrate-binding protein